MNKKVIIHDVQKKLDAFFTVDEATLSFEKYDGTMSSEIKRLNFERKDAVAAVLYDKEKNVVLIEQFRYPSFTKGDGWIMEVAAGILKENETPEVAIKREILEETGYSSKKMEHISTFYVSPGGSSERIFLFGVEVELKDKIEHGGGVEEEEEDIRIIEKSLDEFWLEYEEGKIIDAKTIIALMWLKMK